MENWTARWRRLHEAAEHLGVGPSRVRKPIRSGSLADRQACKGAPWLIQERALQSPQVREQMEEGPADPRQGTIDSAGCKRCDDYVSINGGTRKRLFGTSLGSLLPRVRAFRPTRPGPRPECRPPSWQSSTPVPPWPRAHVAPCAAKAAPSLPLVAAGPCEPRSHTASLCNCANRVACTARPPVGPGTECLSALRYATTRRRPAEACAYQRGLVPLRQTGPLCVNFD